MDGIKQSRRGDNFGDRSGQSNGRYNTGLTMKDSPHRGIYNSWLNMKARCLRKNHPKYPRYGGRGIKICDQWMDIKQFYEWAIKAGWERGMTIDRIDMNGDYCPENCRWVTASDNSRRKSTTKITRDQADSIRLRASLGEDEYKLADEFGVVHGTIWFIVNGYTHVDDMECTKKLKRKLTS